MPTAGRSGREPMLYKLCLIYALAMPPPVPIWRSAIDSIFFKWLLRRRARLIWANGHESVRKTHAYVERVLPILARAFYSSEQDNQGIPVCQIKQIKRFAREIEVIAPACDAGDVREDNSEYPWLDGIGIVQTPCLHSFPHLDDGDRVVILLIRLIRIAAESYTR
jgi:hypothetical protein